MTLRRRRLVAELRVRHGLLHPRLLAVHLRRSAGDPPDHRPPRQPDRRRWDGGRCGDHAGAGRGRQRRPDRARDPDRDPGRRDRLAARPDDPDAADGGALQRRGRRRRGADLLGRVPPPARAGRGDPAGRPDPDPVLAGGRLGLVLGLEHRLREAPGADLRAPDQLPRPAHRQRHPARRDPRRLRCARGQLRLGSLAGAVHRRADRARPCWETCSCCRSAAPTCRW